MKRLIALLLVLASPAWAQVCAQSGCPSPVTGIAPDGAGGVVLTHADGTTSASTGALPLTGDASGTAAASVVPIQRPAYISIPVAAGATVALPAGYAIYDLTGAGVVATSTVRLPPNPQDKQTARIAVIGALTITAMTITDASGNAVASGLAMGLLTDALYQYQSGAWVAIGH